MKMAGFFLGAAKYVVGLLWHSSIWNFPMKNKEKNQAHEELGHLQWGLPKSLSWWNNARCPFPISTREGVISSFFLRIFLFVLHPIQSLIPPTRSLRAECTRVKATFMQRDLSLVIVSLFTMLFFTESVVFLMVVASFLPYVTCCWYDTTSPYGKSLILFDSFAHFCKVEKGNIAIWGSTATQYKPKSHFFLETISRSRNNFSCFILLWANRAKRVQRASANDIGRSPKSRAPARR